MISQSAEYALRAVVCLAACGGRPMTIQQVADKARIPAGYLAKVLASLARSGLVLSQRGIGGGYVLAREPEAITLLEVVQVADPSRRIHVCPLGLPEHANGNLCPLHRHLDQAAESVECAMAAVTIAQVLAESGVSAPLGVDLGDLVTAAANDDGRTA